MDANDRLKRRADAATWAGLAAATVVHFLLFAFSPTWTTDVEATVIEPPVVVDVDPAELPPPPEDPPRPADPVPSPDVPDDVTIAPAPDWNAVPELPPPPPSADREADEGGLPFSVMTVAPRLLNPEEVARRLEREYPAVLRDAGIGGTVTLYVHVDADGTVLESRIGVGSGLEGLDRAALQVAEAFRFSPALNRDRRVPVWIALPVRFIAR